MIIGVYPTYKNVRYEIVMNDSIQRTGDPQKTKLAFSFKKRKKRKPFLDEASNEGVTVASILSAEEAMKEFVRLGSFLSPSFTLFLLFFC